MAQVHNDLNYVSFVIYLAENILTMAIPEFSSRFEIASVITAVYIYALGYPGLVKTEINGNEGIIGLPNEHRRQSSRLKQLV